jgi:ABC-type uncharacterized transport system permease subunit
VRTRTATRVWAHIVAPIAAAAGLIAACVLIIHNYPLLTGSTSDVVNRLPYVLVLAALIGFVLGGRGAPRTATEPMSLELPGAEAAIAEAGQ